MFGLLIQQSIALYAATQVTKSQRDNGKSWTDTLKFGLTISAVLATISTFQGVTGQRCVETADPMYGGCSEYEYVEKTNPVTTFGRSMLATVPMGLVSLALRKRYEEN